METYLLGIDIGGTGCKAGLMSIDGQLLRESHQEISMRNTAIGQAEQDASQWWQAALLSIVDVIKVVPAEQIAAIGISCTNGLVAVDQEINPLTPAIMLWDQRTLPEALNIRTLLGEENIIQITGNPAAPGAYSLPIITWIKKHYPDIYRDTYKFLVPGGFLVAKLTGRCTIDHSRACTTMLFDIRRRQWHRPFFEKLDISLEKMPELLPSHEIVGQISTHVASQTGLSPNTRVIAGCMDTLSAAVGANCLEPSKTFIIMGTAARICTPLNHDRLDPRFMNSTQFKQGEYLEIGAINGVGSSLQWVRDHLALQEQILAKQENKNVYDLITERASQAIPGAQGLIYLPYIAAERTPIWDPQSRGVLFGLTLSHTRNDIFRAFLEGPGYALRHTLEILKLEHHQDISRIYLGGTASTNTVWMQIIADILNTPICTISDFNIEVLGAAILAGVGAKVYPDLENALQITPPIDAEYHPNHRYAARYKHLFQIYKEIYENTRHLFGELQEATYINPVENRKELLDEETGSDLK
jgi:xylulokinase